MTSSLARTSSLPSKRTVGNRIRKKRVQLCLVSSELHGAAALDHLWPVGMRVFPLHLLSFGHVPFLPVIKLASYIVLTNR